MLRLLFNQIDASWLAVLRIGFGCILLFDCINYGVFLCLDCDYHQTDLLFKYAGFEWVHALPTPWLKTIWLLMGVCAIGIILGYYYRLAMVLFTLGFIYQFLLDQALYLNHFYMVILFCILMCLVPANRYWALDARRRPALASDRTPAWTRFLLGAQLEIILIYAGLVKINHDWLRLEPLRLWLTDKSADAGPLLQWLTQDWGIAVAAYGSIALHLIGAPLLLIRKTRLWVLLAYACFHTTNAFVFNIGIFPWFTLFASLIFFDPDWPRQVWRWLQQRFSSAAGLAGEAITQSRSTLAYTGQLSVTHWGILGLILVWLLVQLLLPLRHLTRPGDVAWNEDGHRYAWRMKLRSKRGRASFNVIADNGQFWQVTPEQHLNPRQARKMPCIPDMVWQFAHFLEDHYKTEAHTDLKVHANIHCSLNARPYARFVDQHIDLTTVNRYDPVQGWLMPEPY